MAAGPVFAGKVAPCYHPSLVSRSATKCSYDLAAAQALIAKGSYAITLSALNGAMQLGLDREDIVACVLALDESAFYKTMPSQTRKGFFQDVYKPTYLSNRIYLKLQIDGALAVISFKQDESI